MAVLSGDYTGCLVLIYDAEGNPLSETSVVSHDKESLRIELQRAPPALNAGDRCRLLILASPVPCEYQGKVTDDSSKKIIAMYRGKEKESRKHTRYKVRYPARIDHSIYEGRAYRLHTPLELTVIDISRNGARLLTPYYSLSDGDRFQMSLKINNSEKLLVAEVRNHIDHNPEDSQYGCRFLSGNVKEG